MNIFAYTETESYQEVYYPAYVSLNKRDDGSIRLSVRTRGTDVASEIQLSQEILKQLAEAIESLPLMGEKE